MLRGREFTLKELKEMLRSILMLPKTQLPAQLVSKLQLVETIVTRERESDLSFFNFSYLSDPFD